MTTYIALFDLTHAGVKAAKDSPRRLDAAKKLLADMGGEPSGSSLPHQGLRNFRKLIWMLARPITTRSIRPRVSVCKSARSGDSLPRACATRVSTSAAGTRRIDPALLLSPCRDACDT